MNKRFFWIGLLASFGIPFLALLAFEEMPLLLDAWSFYPTRHELALWYALITLVLWLLFANFAPKAESLSERILPPFLAMVCFAGAWMAALAYSGSFYRQSMEIAATPYSVLFLRLHSGERFLYPLFPAIGFLIGAGVMSISRPFPKRAGGKLLAILLCIALALGGGYALELNWLSTRVLTTGDAGVARVGTDVDLYRDRPFDFDYNQLALPDQPPSLSIAQDYPKIDGATALYPCYAAIAQALFPNMDGYSADYFIDCSKTPQAYERLIKGECDLIFCLQPSDEQAQAAKDAGKELKLTPIAREAFVFFVNRDNPVDNLTIAQIQDIYQKKITNWKHLGGPDQPIIAFQRNEGSGSQTAMLHEVMQGKPMAEPLREEYLQTMEGVVNQVAEYRDYPNAIGYSFRFFTTEMMSSANVKLLSVEGVAPTVENIQRGAYPFTVDEYIVTAGTQNPHVQPLIDWVLSDEGQALVEKTGRVPLG